MTLLVPHTHMIAHRNCKPINYLFLASAINFLQPSHDCFGSAQRSKKKIKEGKWNCILCTVLFLLLLFRFLSCTRYGKISLFYGIGELSLQLNWLFDLMKFFAQNWHLNIFFCFFWNLAFPVDFKSVHIDSFPAWWFLSQQ